MKLMQILTQPVQDSNSKIMYYHGIKKMKILIVTKTT